MKFDKSKKIFILSITCLTLIAFLILSQPSNQNSFTLLENESNFLKEIFSCSDEQLLIDKSVLMKTISFMLQETDEFDPKLIEFVRSIIRMPSKFRKLNLTHTKRKDFSQIGQSKWVDGVLKERRNGFFVEAGAYDGEDHSNTLFFELERNWTGILIEPVPHLFSSILSKNRNVFALNACIANQKTIVAKFRIAEVLSGRLKEMNEGHLKRIEKETGKEKLIYVPCFSLNTTMRALGREHVDYFSLDVEGGEFDVVRGFKYHKLSIDTFTIEHNGHVEMKNNIVSHLERNGFVKLKEDVQDAYFKNNVTMRT